LRTIIQEQGSDDIVYVDETGFERQGVTTHGWKKQGKRLYGERSGRTRTRTSLVAAKRGKELLAPVLFEGTMDGKWFCSWIEECLTKELRTGSTVIMDNASFHNKQRISKLLEEQGHTALFLPVYSPDLNPIEQVFAHIKRKRRHTPELSLDALVNVYGNYLE
jgi:transposase